MGDKEEKEDVKFKFKNIKYTLIIKKINKMIIKININSQSIGIICGIKEY